MIGALRESDSGLCQVRLSGLPQPVQLVERGGEFLGARGVVGHQEIERDLRVGHAAGGVEPRSQHEGDVVRRQRIGSDSADSGERCERHPWLVPHPVHPVGDQRAVLGGQRNDVGDGAERGEVGQVAPHLREAEKPSNRLDELQRDTGAGEVAGGAVVRVELGVGHGDSDGQQVAGLVMIGDHDGHTPLGEHRHLRRGRYAAVDGDHEVGLEQEQPIDRRRREAITLVETMRNDSADLGAHGCESTSGDGAGRDAVKVEVAEDDDMLATAHGCSDPLGSCVESRDERRGEPVTVQARRQEALDLLRRRDSARHEDACCGARQPGGLGEHFDRRRVGRQEGPRRLGAGFRHALILTDGADTVCRPRHHFSWLRRAVSRTPSRTSWQARRTWARAPSTWRRAERRHRSRSTRLRSDRS